MSRRKRVAATRTSSSDVNAPINGGGDVEFGVIALLVLLAFYPGHEQPGHALRSVVLLVSAPALVGLVAIHGRRGPFPRVVALLGVVALLPGVWRVLATEAPSNAALARDLATAAGFWLVAFAAAWRGRASSGLVSSGFAPWIGVAVGVIAAVGLMQAWFGLQVVEQRAAPASLFLNRNVAGHALVAALPWVLVGWRSATRESSKWGNAVVFALAGSLILASRSRGTVLAAAAAVIVFLLLVQRGRDEGQRAHGKGKAARVVRVAFVVAMISMALVVPTRDGPTQLAGLSERLGMLGDPRHDSSGIRLALWANSAAMVVDQPWIGHGPGTFAAVYPVFHSAWRTTPSFGEQRHPVHAHSDFLEVAVERGAPAAVATLVLLLTAGYRAGRLAMGGKDGTAAACASVLLGSIVLALVDFPLQSPASTYLVALAAGFGLRGEPELAMAAWMKFLTVGVAGLAVIGAVLVGGRDLRAQAELRRTLVAERERDCEAVLRSAAAVFEHAPWARREQGIAALSIYGCERDAQASLTYLERALALNPNHGELLRSTGARRLKVGESSGAESAFRSAVAVRSDDDRAWLGLAMALDRQGRWDEAREACERAMAREPVRDVTRAYCGGRTAMR